MFQVLVICFLTLHQCQSYYAGFFDGSRVQSMGCGKKESFIANPYMNLNEIESNFNEIFEE